MNRSTLLISMVVGLSAASFADEIASYSFVNKTNKPHQFTVTTLKHNVSGNTYTTHNRQVNVPAAKGRNLGKSSGQIPINTERAYSVYWVKHHTAPEGPVETRHSTSAMRVDHYNIECEVGMNHTTTCKTR